MAAGPTFSNQAIGRSGSLAIGHGGVTCTSRTLQHLAEAGARAVVTTSFPVNPMPPERSGAFAYMVDRIRQNMLLEDMLAFDINVPVMEVFEAVQSSARRAKADRSDIAPMREGARIEIFG